MRIKPDFDLNSVFEIDVNAFKDKGIKALFFDLDSTLMKSKSAKFEQKTLDFLESLSQDFKLAIISNNNNPNYIEKARSQVNFPVVGGAKKPDIKVLLKTCDEIGVPPSNCAFVGDRPLTDILCAKRSGMVSVLVDSISKEEEAPIVRFVRKLERLSIKK